MVSCGQSHSVAVLWILSALLSCGLPSLAAGDRSGAPWLSKLRSPSLNPPPAPHISTKPPQPVPSSEASWATDGYVINSSPIDNRARARFLERSKASLKEYQRLLLSLSKEEGDDPTAWVWHPNATYPSVPFLAMIPGVFKEPRRRSVIDPSSVGITLPPSAVHSEIERVCRALLSQGHKKLCEMFRKCYSNSLSTTTALLDDGTTFVATGDIPAMWIRDSSGQMSPYLAQWQDPTIQRVVEGVITRQSKFLIKSPYGSAFCVSKPDSDWNSPNSNDLGRNLYVDQHNWESDSFSYHIWLTYRWWKTSGRTHVFTDQWIRVLEMMLHLLTVEQCHEEVSLYRYVELDRGGVGSETAITGMVWSESRPSDDQQVYGYLVPANMFLVVTLRYAADISRTVYRNNRLATQAEELADEIDAAINQFGVVTRTDGSKMYAYEVDGLGGYLIMDDANFPNLLSIPYIDFQSIYDPLGTIARDTHRAVLSDANSWFFNTSGIAGLGSPHTGSGRIWHLGILMQVLISQDHREILHLFEMLQLTDANTDLMHESFEASDPSNFSRPWFAWANSMFAEAVLRHLEVLSHR